MSKAQGDSPEHKLALPGWQVRSMQIAGAGLLLAGPVLHAFGIAQGSAGYLMGGGVGLLVFASLDRLESFSAWGVSAKLREAQAAASEASASAAQVRAVALPLTRMALSMAMGAGRWGDTDALLAIANEQAQRVLDALRATQDERWDAYQEWSGFVIYDAAHEVIRAMYEGAADGARADINAAHGRLLEFGPAGARTAPASEFGAVARGAGVLSTEVAARIEKLAELQQRAAVRIPLDGAPRRSPDG